MQNNNYSATIEVAKSPKDVFDQINDVAKWWATKEFKGQCEGHSTKLNDEFVVRFGDAHYSKQKLVEVIPGKKVVWLVTECKINWIEKDKTEWTNTKMVFELMPNADGTVLKFTHEGLVPEQECYSKCVQGWDMLITKKLYDLVN